MFIDNNFLNYHDYKKYLIYVHYCSKCQNWPILFHDFAVFQNEIQMTIFPQNDTGKYRAQQIDRSHLQCKRKQSHNTFYLLISPVTILNIS